MAHLAAAALCVGVAAAGVYALCRHLCCARLPALFGAVAWACSEALLRPGAGAPRFALAGSSVLVPFAVAGMFSRERRRWPFLALALVCVTLRWRTGAAGPAELEALVLAVLAGLGAQRLWDGEGGPAFLIGATVAVIAAVENREAGAGRLLVEALPATAALALVALTSRQVRARAGLAALVVLFAVQRALEIGLRLSAGSGDGRLPGLPVLGAAVVSLATVLTCLVLLLRRPARRGPAPAA